MLEEEFNVLLKMFPNPINEDHKDVLKSMFFAGCVATYSIVESTADLDESKACRVFEELEKELSNFLQKFKKV